MELGYHVLLEKPIAKTLKEALELRDMARALKRRVAVCHVPVSYTQLELYKRQGLYCGRTFFGLVCDNQLYVKITGPGLKMFPQQEQGCPCSSQMR